jgi:hypothetical protein
MGSRFQYFAVFWMAYLLMQERLVLCKTSSGGELSVNPHYRIVIVVLAGMMLVRLYVITIGE